ncbi:DUF4397 domain-containing protein [Plantactinospora solaniradicis]|uniref:DUF4397 domain-containing protein n=1 Tax=Plantactinospora solaniradicis TaxID=1723736 RepID=A0ABW1KFE0_9ACTN
MDHTTTSLIRIGRRIAAGAAALGLGLGLSTLVPTPATASAEATVGYVRLAHLSPDTPAVDVYLGAATDSAKPQVFKAVGYGVLSPYLPLPVGPYAVAMRRAGAPATDPPVLTERVSVAAGKAYTVAGVGRYAGLGLKVLDDDLSAPPDGRAKVRVVQASVRAPVIDVSVAEGASIASGVQFATTTAYHEVEPGRSTLRLSATGAKPTTVDVSLADGTVYSLLVLDAKQSGLTTELRVDARGGVVVPSGGVDTGAGGTAGRNDSTYPIGLASVGALLAVVVTATGRRLFRLRRRRTS